MRVFWNILNRTLSVYWIARARHVLGMLKLRSRDSVLEVGCGVGLWTEIFISTGARTVALDINLDRAKAARSRTGAKALVIVASAEALPFAKNSFSKLTCIDVIEHVADDATAAGEFARVLEPGGHCMMTTLCVERRPILYRVHFADHLREYTWGALTALSHAAGLKVIGTFEFYRYFAQMAWEGQHIIMDAEWLRYFPGLSTLLWSMWALVAQLDSLSRADGAGLGLLAEKRP